MSDNNEAKVPTDVKSSPGLFVQDCLAILRVFTADLPQAVRIMNAPAITEEIEVGREVTAQDDELPDQSVYDRHKYVLGELVAAGVLQVGNYLAEEVYGLTLAEQRFWREQAITFLLNRSSAEQNRAEHGDVPWDVASRRRDLLDDACDLLKTPLEPGR